MPKKKNPDLKVSATVRLKAQSGEIITGQVVHVWEDKSVPMVRVASGDLGLAFDLLVPVTRLLRARLLPARL